MRFVVTTLTGTRRDYVVEATTRDAAWRYVQHHHAELTPVEAREFADYVERAASIPDEVDQAEQ